MTDSTLKTEYHRFTLRVEKRIFERIAKEAKINRRATGKEIECILDDYIKYKLDNKA